MIRRTAREMALQALFQLDVYENVKKNLSLESVGEIDYSDFTAEAALGAAFAEREDEEGLKAQDYAEFLVKGVLAARGAIDERISQFAVDWSLDRMLAADRNILRIAVFECLEPSNNQRVDASVAINEAVEIAKLYGSDESPRFINGVLGKMVRLA